MASIRQNSYPDSLPDFRNLGVVARALVAVNLLGLGAALASEADWMRALDAFVQNTVLIEPPLLATLATLYAASPLLRRLPYWPACVLIVALALALAAATRTELGQFADVSLARVLAFTAAGAVVVLAYLSLHLRAHSPALAEARLQALQARIRPHFLFNSLNAVLSLIRRDPRRAERALEDLADLFRELMADGRRFVRLADEIALLERYAGIEQLRLGERLRIVWELDGAPSDALLPPMVLQPLLENAIYHGVEPGTGPGEVLVRIELQGDRLVARIENPVQEGVHAHRTGNRMALENILERLRLFFDAEAQLRSRVENGRYRVEIAMPYKTGGVRPA